MRRAYASSPPIDAFKANAILLFLRGVVLVHFTLHLGIRPPPNDVVHPPARPGMQLAALLPYPGRAARGPLVVCAELEEGTVCEVLDLG